MTIPNADSMPHLDHSTIASEDDWDGPQGGPALKVDDIVARIAQLEAEQRAKNQPLSGRIIQVCRSLPYTCTLVNRPSHLPEGHVEIRQGDSITFPQGLHTPNASVSPSSPSSPAAIKSSSSGYINGSHAPSTSGPAIGESNGSSNSTSSHLRRHRERTSSPSACASPAADSLRWVLTPKRGHAALNSGIKSLATMSDKKVILVAGVTDLQDAWGEWIDPARVPAQKAEELEKGFKDLAAKQDHSITCVPVWNDDKLNHAFYNEFCKGYLWPTLHYLPLSDTFDKETELRAWQGYYQANAAYARKVIDVYQPGDLIWIHDYHLCLAPRMIKEAIPNAAVGMFLHAPFPSSEFLRCLPRRDELLDGLLGANLCCFQTQSYGRHFLSSCVRVLGHEGVKDGVDAKGSITAITHCPIGIDAERVEEDRKAPGVQPKIESLLRMYAGKKIIVGRDRLDQTKGVLPKLQAYERLLHDHPEWREKVVMVQVTTPLPWESPALMRKVSEMVDHINSTYGSLRFQPLHWYHQTIARDEYFALLSVADLALITSIRDGMNTTSMEYTICQAEKKSPLILSEFTGVTGSMKQAIKINPWDIGGCAAAINNALTMPEEEKVTRHAQLYERVTTHTSAVWAWTLVLQLAQAIRVEQASTTPAIDGDELRKCFKESSKRMCLFDYDGTLTPIVKEPSAAVPSKLLLKTLETLCADDRNIVYIISGRDGAFLDQHLGHIKRLGFSAEHGCFLKEPGKTSWVNLTEKLDMSWMVDVEEIFKYYETRTKGAFVEKKRSSVTFHYRNADPVFGVFQAKECQAILDTMQERLPIDVLVGKKNLEVRPEHMHKGDIVKRLMFQHPDAEFAICAGDDKTDEDMFRTLLEIRDSTNSASTPLVPPPELYDTPKDLNLPVDEDGRLKSPLKPEAIFTIAIDSNPQRRTNALWHVDGAEEMVELLSTLAELK